MELSKFKFETLTSEEMIELKGGTGNTADARAASFTATALCLTLKWGGDHDCETDILQSSSSMEGDTL